MKSIKLLALVVTASVTFWGCGSDLDEVTTDDIGSRHLATGPYMPTQPMDHVYELLATKNVPGLGAQAIADKKLAVDEVIDLLVTQANKMPGTKVALGTNGANRFNFPPVDLNMDGTPDEVGKKLEVSLPSDGWMLATTDRALGIGMRWSIGVYTDGDLLKIVIGVPETFVRLYFRGQPNLSSLANKALGYHGTLRFLVDKAVKGQGYTTRINQGLAGTEMGDAMIAQIEQMMGPITAESIAPSLTLSGVQVDDVVSAIENAFAVPRVPDLNGDGNVDAADQMVLPTMFGMFMQGAITFEQMAGMMGQGYQLWSNGYTFQQWVAPRTVDLSGPLQGKYYIIELCQPFYAGTALFTGLHHVPSMPCAVAVWEEQGQVRLNVLDPNFIFAYFFSDAGPTMPPAMQQLFAVFPTLVFNDLAAVVNAAMKDIGSSAALPLHSFPPMP